MCDALLHIKSCTVVWRTVTLKVLYRCVTQIKCQIVLASFKFQFKIYLAALLYLLFTSHTILNDGPNLITNKFYKLEVSPYRQLQFLPFFRLEEIIGFCQYTTCVLWRFWFRNVITYCYYFASFNNKVQFVLYFSTT